MKISRYSIATDKLNKTLKYAIVGDLHSKSPDKVLSVLSEVRPDIILCPGDIFNKLDGSVDGSNENAFAFLNKANKIARVIYSFGNHEIGGYHKEMRKWSTYSKDRIAVTEDNKRRIRESGTLILDNETQEYEGVLYCGLGSGLLNSDRVPNIDPAIELSKKDGFKLLLCHHPEYYPRYLSGLDIDLTVSGHAHGGQWRLFGRGVYAPDQGLFPKYTSGLHDGKLIITRGVVNTVPYAPRFFNPCEIPIIEVSPKE